jgi:hypothetical protein
MPQLSWDEISDISHRLQAIYSSFANTVLQLRTTNAAIKELQEVIDKIVDKEDSNVGA